VLVDDELIHAFYDQQLPADVCSGANLERWFREESKRQPKLLQLTRDELMRHEAAGITTTAFPKTLRLGGVGESIGLVDGNLDLALGDHVEQIVGRSH